MVRDAWVAPGATVIGRVQLAKGASVWHAAVLRGDGDRIEIGPGSNVQDGCVVHADPGFPVLVSRDVTVGHRAVLHGCTVEDGVLVGIGAIVLNGARLGAGTLVAAGTVVLEGTDIPPGSLVAGVPGKVRRSTTEAEREDVIDNARRYAALAGRYAAGELG